MQMDFHMETEIDDKIRYNATGKTKCKSENRFSDTKRSLSKYRLKSSQSEMATYDGSVS